MLFLFMIPRVDVHRVPVNCSETCTGVALPDNVLLFKGSYNTNTNKCTLFWGIAKQCSIHSVISSPEPKCMVVRFFVCFFFTFQKMKQYKNDPTGVWNPGYCWEQNIS